MAIVATPVSARAANRGEAMLARILDLLREEHAALENGDVQSVAALAAAKDRAIAELRQAVGAHAGHVGNQDRALAGMVREARDANLANGQHAAALLAYNRTRLNGLMVAAREAGTTAADAGLYRADGFTGGRGVQAAMFGRA